MFKLRHLIIPLILCTMATSCPYGYKYNTGFLPTTPVNLEDFNTQFDDYNLSAPTLDEITPLFFSSNRNSQGNDYDIVSEIFHLQFDKDDGNVSAGRWSDEWNIQYNPDLLNTLSNIMNTSFNELGPCVISLNDQLYSYYGKEDNQYLALWACDEKGTLDIMITHNSGEDGKRMAFIDPVRVNFLNTDGNNAYPAIDFNRNRVYFCSDRDQEFNIYSCDLPEERPVIESLTDTTMTPDIELCEVLSSSSNDKCPSLMNSYSNVLVFASDRPGGHGGYDLWYSLDGDPWTEPKNFGPDINTEYDEYRPIIMDLPEFKHDLLMFSSNRPGGKGGFDLYFAGVEKLIKSDY